MLAILPSIIPVAACWSNCQVFFPLLHVGHTAKYCSRCCMLVTLPSIVPIAACWSHCYVFFPLLHVGHTAKYCSHCCMLVTLPQVFHSFAWSVILWILASDKISGSWQFISFFFFCNMTPYFLSAVHTVAAAVWRATTSCYCRVTKGQIGFLVRISFVLRHKEGLKS